MRDLLEQFLLAGVGAVALTRDRVEELADELAKRGQLTREEAREAIEETLTRWRRDAGRTGERASVNLAGVLRELGLVTRREWEELELRVAQIDHRVRLLESEPRGTARPAP